MTKKDYILLAQFMRDIRPPRDDANGDARWHAGVVTLSHILKRDNPAFNAVKFCEACEALPTYGTLSKLS